MLKITKKHEKDHVLTHLHDILSSVHVHVPIDCYKNIHRQPRKVVLPEFLTIIRNNSYCFLFNRIETNVIEAAANGAAVAGKTVAAVTVNLLAFLSVLAFINATLSWIGGRVGYPELSFEVINPRGDF